MLKDTLLVITLSLIQAATQTAAASTKTDAVDAALRDVGTGSVEEMKKRMLSLPFTVRDGEYRRVAVEALPAPIRRSRITGGNLLRRVESRVEPVLRLHRREGRVELFLYQDKFPRGMLWRECVLVLSDSLVEPLEDVELIGVVAHELAHAYFMDELAEARKAKDNKATRAIELKCDAVAMMTLLLLGEDPVHYVRGLQRITVITKSKGYQTMTGTHPQIAERESFARLFIRSIGTEHRRHPNL